MLTGEMIGPYRVLEKLGEGGMGEVYRATDTTLGRQVAIKVLPAAFAQDGERLARFEREAKTLAALNHPHIAQIYGFDRSSGVHALIMELVEGEDLSQRIARGAIPLDEALPMARQIADALEAAHEQGIIHRDLKPANIRVTPDGVVKVLDFGLAKAMANVGRGFSPAGQAGPEGPAYVPLSQSPTISAPAMLTGAGVILGTAAYMSPEQAKGREADKRSDMWAFGCVVFEMLTGTRAFSGEDVTDTIVAVMSREPEWAALPPATPAPVRRLLRRCLEKDRRERLPDAAMARLEIKDALVAADGRSAASSTPVRRPSAWRRAAPIAATAALAGTVAALVTWAMTRPPSPQLVHLALSPPAARFFDRDFNDANLAISRDGRTIAYVASAGSGTSNPIYVRAMDADEARLVVNAARGPFFSPDGKWVGFQEETRLSKVAVTGGPSVTIGDIGGGLRGGSWGPDDTIVFGTSDGATGLSRIPAGGGTSEVLTKPDRDKGEVDHLFPEVLPEGRGVLFTIMTNQGADRSQIAVLDLSTRTYRVVLQGGSHARYSASGHLVYGASGALRAVAFDVARLEVTGTPVPVVSGVSIKANGAVSFALSADGILVYLAGGRDGNETLAWVDRTGREEPLGIEEPSGRRGFDDPVLSPDGTQVAVAVGASTGNQNLWIWSLTRRALTRLTFEPGFQRNPVWTRDGTKIVYQSADAGLFWRNADGTGVAEALLETEAGSPSTLRPRSWSVDNRLLFFDARRGGSIGVVPAQGKRALTTLLANPGQDPRPVVSPDGRWLAYVSAESGRPEVYVRPFPTVDAGKWQISTGGANGSSSPRWTSNGRALLFSDGDNLLEVAVETSPTFKASSPQRVLAWPASVTSDFDISRDGARFLVVQQEARDATPAQLGVVLNWSEELKRLAPTN